MQKDTQVIHEIRTSFVLCAIMSCVAGIILLLMLVMVLLVTVLAAEHLVEEAKLCRRQ